jgi:hypothetical protein
MADDVNGAETEQEGGIKELGGLTARDANVQAASGRLAGFSRTISRDNVGIDVARHSDGGRILILVDAAASTVELIALSTAVADDVADKLRTSGLVLPGAGSSLPPEVRG